MCGAAEKGGGSLVKININIPGEPVAKGRPRLGKGFTYTPEKTVNYENLVKLCFMQQANTNVLSGELKAEIKAYFQIPKSASKKKNTAMEKGEIRLVKRPDIDNVIKAILDSLNGLAYGDDSQVVCISAEKYYSNNPRVEVEISEIKEAEIA